MCLKAIVLLLLVTAVGNVMSVLILFQPKSKNKKGIFSN